jgi:cytochrome c553
MTAIAKALSPDDIADVAAYYATVETPFPPLATGDPDLVAKGQQLAEIGNAAKGLPSCSACHGARGAGELPTVPYLGGSANSTITAPKR